MRAFDQILLLIEQNCWQDVALSAGNIFFCFTLIPMLRHPGRPPLLTCIPTALALLAGGFVFATLHLWVTALTQAITGLQWLVMAFKEISLEHRTSPGGERGSGIGMIDSAPASAKALGLIQPAKRPHSWRIECVKFVHQARAC